MTLFAGAGEVFVLKIVLTPLLVLGASLAGRYWGQSIGGWLIGLPLTSGPIAFFLAIDQGQQFVQDAAAGVVGGAAAQGFFCVAYGWAAAHWRWPFSLAAGLLGYGVAVTMMRAAAIPFALLVPLAFVLLLACVRLMPKATPNSGRTLIHPPWDLPIRMAVATILVVALTAAAPLTGPWLSGVLATVPIFGSVLAAFAHRNYGPDKAVNLLSGFLLGAFAVVGFFFVLSNAIMQAGIAGSFLAAIAAAFAVQGFTLWAMRRRKKS